MKSARGLIGYVATVSALVALCVTGVSYAVAPYGSSSEAMKAEQTVAQPSEKIADKTAALTAAVTDGERQPTWIAPTHKYPVSALTMKAPARPKHGLIARNDYRLQERQTAFNAPSTMSSYAAEPRTMNYAPAPRYNEPARYTEPMQFRERTEPR